MAIRGASSVRIQLSIKNWPTNTKTQNTCFFEVPVLIGFAYCLLDEAAFWGGGGANVILDEFFRYMMVDTIKEDKWILSKISGASEGRRQFLNEFDWTIVQYRKRVVDLFKNI